MKHLRPASADLLATADKSADQTWAFDPKTSMPAWPESAKPY